MKTLRLKKEILGILCLFLVGFTAVSLITYHPSDPVVLFNSDDGLPVKNFFGPLGAHTSGLLIGFFGIGSFWIPVLLSLAMLALFRPRQEAPFFYLLISGGLLLIISTGALASLIQSEFTAWHRLYPSGGIVGSLLGDFLVRIANRTGAIVILSVLSLIGFIIATGISIVRAISAGYHLLQHFFVLCAALLQRCRTIAGGWISGLRKISVSTDRAESNSMTTGRPGTMPKRSGKSSPDGSYTGSKDGKRNESVKDSRKALKENEKKSLVRIKPPAQIKKEMEVVEPVQIELDGFSDFEKYLPPRITFLDDPPAGQARIDEVELTEKSRLLEQKLQDFGVFGEVTAVSPGPVITRFEFSPAPGVKINRIVNLADDLALALKALSIRIVAPIPGKSAVGIEVPNEHREIVYFKEIIASAQFEKSRSPLTIALGKDIVGNPVVAGLEAMPHLLIAGATGTGKSVALNTMISSILFKAGPDLVKFIMIDPKRIELSVYDGIPHLITPVVTDMKKATNALFWAVREMERRYKLLSELRVRNIAQYNAKIEKRMAATADGDAKKEDEAMAPLPFIVIIIDELADLMMVASRDVEVSLTRLAQMARAAGIHLIIATQRPSVDVLTGLIKANFPTRLSFQVSSKTDSRTIIDTNGAEALLGKGDMLFLPPGTAKLQRIHGAYISEKEVGRIIDYLKQQQAPSYDTKILETPAENVEANGETDYDDRYDEAVALVTRTGQASISMIQRHLRIGYNRAARIIEIMEKEGIVGPSDGVKPREVLVRKDYDDMP